MHFLIKLQQQREIQEGICLERWRKLCMGCSCGNDIPQHSMIMSCDTGTACHHLCHVLLSGQVTPAAVNHQALSNSASHVIILIVVCSFLREIVYKQRIFYFSFSVWILNNYFYLLCFIGLNIYKILSESAAFAFYAHPKFKAFIY